MGNKITFECDGTYKQYLPWFNKMEENNHPWVKSMILKPTGLQPIKVVAITPISKENRIKADKYDFKVHRNNIENPDEKITIFFKKIVEKKKSTASAEFSGELADSIETEAIGGEIEGENKTAKKEPVESVKSLESNQGKNSQKQKSYPNVASKHIESETPETEFTQSLGSGTNGGKSGTNTQFPADNMV